MTAFSIFNAASPVLQDWFQRNSTTRSFATTTALIREGERIHSLTLLLSGELTISTSTETNQAETLAVLTTGSLVGEMSWLEQRPAVANVTAMAGTTILEVPFDRLDLIQKQQPSAATELHQLIACKLAQQIREQNAWIHRRSNDLAEQEPLRKVLVLFAALEEQDVHRLAKLGRLERLAPGGCLLRQGEPVQSLYVILSGQAHIEVTLSGTKRVVGSSRRGELLGEMSLLLEEQRGAAATVITDEGMELLNIPQESLKAALDEDPALACRFHRGLACMLSQRSRDQLVSHRLATMHHEADRNSLDMLELSQLGDISRAARHFDWLCRHLQAGAAANR